MKSGYINSIQSLGTLDGPGIRFVVFMQGCNLRCGYCHNPDTWNLTDGTEVTAEELVEKAERFKNYFGNKGGVTVSGGEPLLQASFVTDFFKLCHKKGINTCLDTSGVIINDDVAELLKHTDRVLLDIKFTTDEEYRRYVGCKIDYPLNFLQYLDKISIPVTVRQVIVGGLNDNEDNIFRLKDIVSKYDCIDKTELLPFKKICKVKYDNLGLPFQFDNYITPDNDKINSFLKIINS